MLQKFVFGNKFRSPLKVNTKIVPKVCATGLRTGEGFESIGKFLLGNDFT